MSSVSEPGSGARGADEDVDCRKSSDGPVVELVTLATMYDPVEAEIIVAKLHSAGIQAYLRHDAVSNVIGVAFDGVGKQEIIVREEDLVEAQAALEKTPE